MIKAFLDVTTQICDSKCIKSETVQQLSTFSSSTIYKVNAQLSFAI